MVRHPAVNRTSLGHVGSSPTLSANIMNCPICGAPLNVTLLGTERFPRSVAKCQMSHYQVKQNGAHFEYFVGEASLFAGTIKPDGVLEGFVARAVARERSLYMKEEFDQLGKLFEPRE
jgi:hypothetical protein